MSVTEREQSVVGDFAAVPIDSVREFWNGRPCNIRHSPKPIGTQEYFDEVEARKYFVEPHIPSFADFPRWKGRRVLEIGCGIGTAMVSFLREGARVTAVDLSSESLALARRRAEVYGFADRVTFFEANAEQLSHVVPPEPYDLVYSFGVLHHTPHPLKAIDQIRSFVSPGSTIKLMMYHTRSWKVFWAVLRYGGGRFWDWRRIIARHSEAQTGCPVTYTYTKRELTQILEARGFHVTDIFADHIFQYRIPDYIEYRYRKVWYFRWMPRPMLRWLERTFGWHLCVTAVARDAFQPQQTNPEEPSIDSRRQGLLERARTLAQFRDIRPYPGWHFDIDWSAPGEALRERRDILESFRSAGTCGPVEVEWLNSIRLILYVGNDLSKQLFVAGCFEPNEFAFLNGVLAPGMRFVDAGANEGIYSLFAASRVGQTGRVYSFEPSPREIERLKNNLSLNNFPQLQIFPFALSDENGFSSFSIAEDEHSGVNRFGAPPRGVKMIHSVNVPTRRLDDVAEQEGWDRVDVLKIDVEGAENRLIEGAAHILRTMRPLILFECSASALEGSGSSREELLEKLRSFDYVIYRFDESTGLPVPAAQGEYGENMIAAPVENPVAASQ